MPIPSPADFRNRTKTNAQMREMLAEMAGSVLGVDLFNAHAMLKSKTLEVDALGTDLNNIIEPGVWICNKSNLDSEVDKNFPIYGSRTSGLLVVYVDSKPNFSLTRQIYITADNLYFRGTFLGSWTDWKELLTSATLNDQLSNVLEQSEQYASEKATTAEKNSIQVAANRIDQLCIFDFHDERGFSSVVVDQNNNIIFGIKNTKVLTANADEFLRDFHTEKFKATYISVDKNFNILNGSSGGASTGLVTSNLQNFAFYPNVLKKGEVYSDFGVLRDQKEWNGDLYNLHANEIITDHRTVYGLYDAIVSQNPSQWSSSVLGVDGLGNEIKQYIYTPRSLTSGDAATDSEWTSDELASPKLVITTGVHGDEKEAILQLIIFLREMFNRQAEISEAALLKQSRLVIVPCVTPSGVDATTRLNHNNVNVNRNARSGFGGNGGTALSQPECAIAVDLVNLHPDASCFIDFHNYHGSGMAAWFSTHGIGNSFKILKKIAYELNIMTPLRFPFLANRPVRIGKNANGTIARDWQLISEKKSYLLETALDEGRYPSFELRQHGLYVLRTALSEIYKDELGV